MVSRRNVTTRGKGKWDPTSVAEMLDYFDDPKESRNSSSILEKTHSVSRSMEIPEIKHSGNKNTEEVKVADSDYVTKKRGSGSSEKKRKKRDEEEPSNSDKTQSELTSIREEAPLDTATNVEIGEVPNDNDPDEFRNADSSPPDITDENTNSPAKDEEDPIPDKEEPIPDGCRRLFFHEVKANGERVKVKMEVYTVEFHKAHEDSAEEGPSKAAIQKRNVPLFPSSSMFVPDRRGMRLSQAEIDGSIDSLPYVSPVKDFRLRSFCPPKCEQPPVDEEDETEPKEDETEEAMSSSPLRNPVCEDSASRVVNGAHVNDSEMKEEDMCAEMTPNEQPKQEEESAPISSVDPVVAPSEVESNDEDGSSVNNEEARAEDPVEEHVFLKPKKRPARRSVYRTRRKKKPSASPTLANFEIVFDKRVEETRSILRTARRISNNYLMMKPHRSINGRSSTIGFDASCSKGKARKKKMVQIVPHTPVYHAVTPRPDKVPGKWKMPESPPSHTVRPRPDIPIEGNFHEEFSTRSSPRKSAVAPVRFVAPAEEIKDEEVFGSPTAEFLNPNHVEFPVANRRKSMRRSEIYLRAESTSESDTDKQASSLPSAQESPSKRNKRQSRIQSYLKSLPSSDDDKKTSDEPAEQVPKPPPLPKSKRFVARRRTTVLKLNETPKEEEPVTKVERTDEKVKRQSILADYFTGVPPSEEKKLEWEGGKVVKENTESQIATRSRSQRRSGAFALLNPTPVSPEDKPQFKPCKEVEADVPPPAPQRKTNCEGEKVVEEKTGSQRAMRTRSQRRSGAFALLNPTPASPEDKPKFKPCKELEADVPPPAPQRKTRRSTYTRKQPTAVEKPAEPESPKKPKKLVQIVSQPAVCHEITPLPDKVQDVWRMPDSPPTHTVRARPDLLVDGNPLIQPTPVVPEVTTESVVPKMTVQPTRRSKRLASIFEPAVEGSAEATPGGQKRDRSICTKRKNSESSSDGGTVVVKRGRSRPKATREAVDQESKDAAPEPETVDLEEETSVQKLAPIFAKPTAGERKAKQKETRRKVAEKRGAKSQKKKKAETQEVVTLDDDDAETTEVFTTKPTVTSNVPRCKLEEWEKCGSSPFKNASKDLAPFFELRNFGTPQCQPLGVDDVKLPNFRPLSCFNLDETSYSLNKSNSSSLLVKSSASSESRGDTISLVESEEEESGRSYTGAVVELGRRGKERIQKGAQWTDAFQPRTIEEFCGNKSTATAMQDWLVEWKAKLKRCVRKENPEPKAQDRKRALGKGFSNSPRRKRQYSSSDSENEDESLENVFVLSGPVGTGKNSLVQALAHQLGYKVIEVGANLHRSKAQIELATRGATNSHRIKMSASGTIAEAFKVSDESSQDSSSSGKRVRLDPNESFSSSQGSQPGSNDRDSGEKLHTIILFDDVDISFRKEDGFWAGIRSTVKNARVPVVMTCRSSSSCELNDIRYREAQLEALSPDDTVAFFQSLFQGLCNRQPFARASLESISERFRHDLRKMMLHFNFWFSESSPEASLGYVAPLLEAGSISRSFASSIDAVVGRLRRSPVSCNLREPTLSYGLGIQPCNGEDAPRTDIVDYLSNLLDAKDFTREEDTGNAWSDPFTRALFDSAILNSRLSSVIMDESLAIDTVAFVSEICLQERAKEMSHRKKRFLHCFEQLDPQRLIRNAFQYPRFGGTLSILEENKVSSSESLEDTFSTEASPVKGLK